MIDLDADAIRCLLREGIASRLAGFEAFGEIASTNSYLMQQEGPAPGQFRVAVTDNQTMGRGRHGRTWQSPPGSGLALSLAYTFAIRPANLPPLTLAIGVGVIDALEALGIGGVKLKWPNDLIAGDGKIGGILTETQSPVSDTITVVTGVGLNINLDEELSFGDETGSVRHAADIAGFAENPPSRDALLARLIDSLCGTFVDYETSGFDRYLQKWPERDWLFGREVIVDTPGRQLSGVGVGIADDGALLLDTGTGAVSRITSGSVVLAGMRSVGA